MSSAVQRQVLIDAGNRADFSKEDLDELVRTIQAEDATVEARVVVRPQYGYAVTWPEVIHVYDLATDLVDDAVLWGSVAAAAAKWARHRWRREREADPERNPRPVMVIVYVGPDGRPLKEITVDAPEGEPVEEDADPTNTRPPPTED